MTPEVRPATSADAPALAAIYGEGIEERQATFRTTPPPLEEMVQLIARERFPVLVAQDDEGVAGFVSVVAHATPRFYGGVGEYGLYVARRARRSGVGAALLEAACDQAQRLGYWKLVGKLFTTNEASIALARRCGFREVGVHLRHGRLEGQWRDVLLIERLLGEAAREGR